MSRHQPSRKAHAAPRDTDCVEGDAQLVLTQVQLLLSEKRTALSVMRTGIAILAIPLSVLSVLIATSKYYDILNVLPLIIPVLATCGLLALLAVYLVLRSIFKLHRLDRLVDRIKARCPGVADLIA